MTTSTKKKPAAEEKFNVAEWLADSDSFSHLDIDVYTSPRYKEWANAKEEFSEIAERLQAADADGDDGTLGEPGEDRERLAEVREKLQELGPAVQESRSTLRFVDAMTQRDIKLISLKHHVAGELDEEGMFFEVLEKFGLFDGEPKTAAEWESLARRVGLVQWQVITARCSQHMWRGEVAPDFSLPSLPSNLG